MDQHPANNGQGIWLQNTLSDGTQSYSDKETESDLARTGESDEHQSFSEDEDDGEDESSRPPIRRVGGMFQALSITEENEGNDTSSNSE